LLGWKKRGLGQDQYAGIGGKLEPGETPPEAAIRELHEEIGVEVALQDLEPLGELTFTFPSKPEWDEVARVFLVRKWQGEPCETAEMVPAWFPVAEIPYEKMWHDYSYWLPRAIRGQNITGTYIYASDNKTVQAVQPQHG
jgi:8-oxo-dGTP diphosphatase